MRLPEVAEYHRHILALIRHLLNETQVNTHCGQMVTSLRTIESTLLKSGSSDWRLVTAPPWVIPIDWPEKFGKKNAELVLGAKITVQSDALTEHVVSFSLATAEQRQHVYQADVSPCCMRDFALRKRIIQQAHFDIDVVKPETSKPVVPRPRIHGQIAGRIPKEAAWLGYHYCLDKYVDEPRLIMPPMDIALLLDLPPRQFRTALNAKFNEDNGWKSLVKQSEELWLKEYFVDGANMLEKTRRGSFYDWACAPLS